MNIRAVILAKLLEDGIVLNSKTFVGIDFDAALDQRDSEKFEREWLRVFAEVEDSFNSARRPAEVSNLLERIQEVSYITAYRHTGNHELCSYISDDFEVFAKALLCNYDDPWLSGIFSEYLSSSFPTGSINPVKTGLFELINDALR